MLKRFAAWISGAMIGAITVISGLAYADYTVTQGVGTTIFAFTCFTSKVCPSHVQINSAGTEIGTTANPVYFDMPATGNLPTALANGTGANGATQPTSSVAMGVNQNGGSNMVALVGDPCQTNAKAYAVINISASGSAKIITGTSSKKTYICSLHLVTNAANNVAMTEGTGSNCGTGTAAVVGSTTAASGWNFSANGGIALGNGGAAVVGTFTNADDVCLNPSASTQLTGQVAYVQQ